MLNKDKHILPGTEDTYADNVKRGAQQKKKRTGMIYGPHNEVLSNVNMEASREFLVEETKGQA